MYAACKYIWIWIRFRARTQEKPWGLRFASSGLCCGLCCALCCALCCTLCCGLCWGICSMLGPAASMPRVQGPAREPQRSGLSAQTAWCFTLNRVHTSMLHASEIARDSLRPATSWQSMSRPSVFLHCGFFCTVTFCTVVSCTVAFLHSVHRPIIPCDIMLVILCWWYLFLESIKVTTVHLGHLSVKYLYTYIA